MMPMIYQYDNQQIFTGASREIAPKEGVPRGWTRAVPPAARGEEVAYFQGSAGWVILPDRPPAPPAPVPAQVTQRQARLALLQAGLLDQVQPALDAIVDATEREAAKIEWEYATDIRRVSPLVNSIGPTLGLDDAAIDDLFRTAAML